MTAVDDSVRVHVAVVAAMRRLSRAATTTTWNTPSDLADHRARLAALVNTGATTYDVPMVYPIFDPSPVYAAAHEAHRLSAQLGEPMRSWIRARIDRTTSHVAVSARRDDAQFSRWQVEHNGLPTGAVVALATEILRGATVADDVPDEAVVGDTELVGCVRDALAAYGIDGWQVRVVANMAARMSVNGPERTVKIRAGVHVSPATRDRLLVHEVGGHVLRWVNAQAQPEPLLGEPLSDARAEEGLACLLEEQLGVSSARMRYTYAARVLAVAWAQSEGLVALAHRLSTVLPVAESAELALRVRRGITDPQAAGGSTNGHHYLTGWEMSRNALQDDPDGVRLLRGTKWSFEHMPLLHDLAAEGRVVPPRWVPDPQLLGVATPH